MTNQNLLALTMAMASAMATSSSGPSPTTGTRSGLCARTTQVRANPDDSDPSEDSSSSKEKPREETASKRKHDGSGDDSETMILLLRNESVDVGPMSFVAIVLVVIRDAMPLNVMYLASLSSHQQRGLPRRKNVGGKQPTLLHTRYHLCLSHQRRG